MLHHAASPHLTILIIILPIGGLCPRVLLQLLAHDAQIILILILSGRPAWQQRAARVICK